MQTETRVVCRIDELPPGEVRIVQIGRHDIGVFNVNGVPYALSNHCPHQGAEVCRGTVTGAVESDGPYQSEWTRDNQIIQCPWHAWQFDITTGQCLAQADRKVSTYRAWIDADNVMIEYPND